MARRDQWILDSALSFEEELTRHLGWLWEQVRPHQDFIRALVESGVDIRVMSHYCSNSHLSGYDVQPGAIEIISELGVPFGTTVEVECDAARQVSSPLECDASFRIIDAADRHVEIEKITGIQPSLFHTKEAEISKGKKYEVHDV